MDLSLRGLSHHPAVDDDRGGAADGGEVVAVELVLSENAQESVGRGVVGRQGPVIVVEVEDEGRAEAGEKPETDALGVDDVDQVQASAVARDRTGAIAQGRGQGPRVGVRPGSRPEAAADDPDCKRPLHESMLKGKGER